MSEVLKIPFSVVIWVWKGKVGPYLRKIISGSHRRDRNVMELASSICVSYVFFYPPPFLLYFFKEKSMFALFLVLLSLVNLFCMQLP